MQTQVPEAQVTGLFIEFEERTTESEAKAIVKAVLDNYNMTVNTINYNYSIMPSRYYIIVDKDKIMDIRDELRKEEIWTDPAIPYLKKGNYYIITVPEQIIHDKNFLMILEKNNLQVKKSVWCYICFRDGYKNGILVEDATRITDELKINKKVLIANPEGQAAGLSIEFENRTTEQGVKAILEGCNMTRNWIIKYNVDYMGNIYYIKVDEDKREELSKEKNWNDPIYPEIPEPRFSEIKIRDHYYIIVPEEDLGNESLLKVIKKHNLQVKKSVVCYILFGDGSGNYSDQKNWITETDAIRIKNDIEMNEKVLIVSPDYIE